jgi:hypothetical protein
MRRFWAVMLAGGVGVCLFAGGMAQATVIN